MCVKSTTSAISVSSEAVTTAFVSTLVFADTLRMTPRAIMSRILAVQGAKTDPGYL